MKTTKATIRRSKKRRSKVRRFLRILAVIPLIPVFLIMELWDYGMKHPKKFLAACFIGSVLVTLSFHAFSDRFPVKNVKASESKDYVEVTQEVTLINDFEDIGPSTTVQTLEVVAETVTENLNIEADDELFSLEKSDLMLAQDLEKQNEQKRAFRVKKEQVTAVEQRESKIVKAKEMAKSMGLPNDYDAELAMVGMCMLVEEGFNPEGAAGLMGNVYCESRFFVGADNGSHFGIFQWDYNDRWVKISKYLEDNQCILYSRYDDYSSYEACGSNLGRVEIFKAQLMASLHSEDAKFYTNTISGCKNATSASESADLWRRNYEVCGAAVSERMMMAEETLKLYYALFF